MIINSSDQGDFHHFGFLNTSMNCFGVDGHTFSAEAFFEENLYIILCLQILNKSNKCTEFNM